MQAILLIFKSAKVWGVIAALTALLGSAWVAYDRIYDSGYDAARVKYQSEKLHAIELALAAARAQWAESQEAAEVQIVVEEKIVERIRVVEREVPKIVEKFVPAECHDLGPDIRRLFNDAIRAGNSDEGSDSADTPITD